MSFMEFFRLAIALIALAAAPGQVSSRESPPLPDFPFDQPGEYEFHFRQVRSREVTLVLEVQSLDGPPNRAVLTHLKTVIEVSLADHRGRLVCKVAGSPVDGVNRDGWVLESDGFWHFGCREMKLQRSERYTLKIRIREVDPNTPRIRLTPTFQRSDDFWL
jgi:hypothetical protein